ncbi:hypothetical protein M1523_04645 [Patescibacteria group bacterium]|nr:hypothetical protein [Patescibacteria group bacterium]
MIEFRGVWNRYRPSKDPYVAARVLETLPHLVGDRGQFVVGMFSYFRWVDDEADERIDLTKTQKLAFLNRQMRLADGFSPKDPLPMEQFFQNLPWYAVPQQEIREQVKVLLSSIVDDVNCQGYVVRSDREITDYNLRTVVPVVTGLFLALNGRSPEPNSSLFELLDAYIRLGSLEGLGDDLKLGVVKLPLTSKKTGVSNIDEVLTEYNKNRFNHDKWLNLLKILRAVGAFRSLNIPAWQKIACMSYICADVLVKKPLCIRRAKAIKPLLRE